MSDTAAAKAMKAVYVGLKDGGIGVDPSDITEKVWNILTPYQRLDWMHFSDIDVHIIYCGTVWSKLPIENRMRLCRSLTVMVELFARIGIAKDAERKNGAKDAKV